MWDDFLPDISDEEALRRAGVVAADPLPALPRQQPPRIERLTRPSLQDFVGIGPFKSQTLGPWSVAGQQQAPQINQMVPQPNSQQADDWNNVSPAGQPDLNAFTGGYGGGGVMAGTRQARQGAGALPVSQYQGGSNVNISPEANGSRPYDMFNAGLPQNPFYMGERPEAIRTLGVNGFRTGSSRPVYDDDAGQAWDQRSRQNFMIQDMLGRQEVARGNQNIDLQRFLLQSQDRNAAIQQHEKHDFDTNLQKLPLGGRTPAIDEGERKKLITPQAAQAMRLEDVMDAGYIAAGGRDSQTGRPKNLEQFMRGVSSRFDPTKMSRAEFINKLVGMGVTADEISELSTKPGLGQFVPSLMGPKGSRSKTAWEMYKGLLSDLFESQHPSLLQTNP